MTWKRLNSDYVYKCHSGISISDKQTLKDPQYYQEFVNKNMLKFFIQFSAVQADQNQKHTESVQKEYLCSIIWIKGSTYKFLEFVSEFSQIVKEQV